jgi:hypothetical protein
MIASTQARKHASPLGIRAARRITQARSQATRQATRQATMQVTETKSEPYALWSQPVLLRHTHNPFLIEILHLWGRDVPILPRRPPSTVIHDHDVYAGSEGLVRRPRPPRPYPIGSSPISISISICIEQSRWGCDDPYSPSSVGGASGSHTRA